MRSMTRYPLVFAVVGALFSGCSGPCTIFEPDDGDQDGYTHEGVGGNDCNDTSAEIYPGAHEVPYNGVDEDCDGSDLTDVDEDGEASKVVTNGTDCNDNDPTVYSRAPEQCDGKDNNCSKSDKIDDGDNDGDPCPTFGQGRDCNDADATIWFGAPEIPYDGIDQDCVDGDVIDFDNDGEPALGAGGIDCNDHLGISEPFEQHELVIYSGLVLMGAKEEDPNASIAEMPLHEVELTAYCIDPLETTNAEYRACVEAGICAEPKGTLTNTGRANYFRDPQYDRYPVVGVTWEDAMTFCAQDDRMLPTEAQWERAAKGGCELQGDAILCEEDVDLRTYPWGEDQPTCAEANYSKDGGFSGCLENQTADTDEISSRPNGISPYGLYNMAGNAAEWIFDYYSGTTYQDHVASPSVNPTGPETGEKRVVRGGGYSDYFQALRTSARSAAFPDSYASDLGFRCARSHLPAVALAYYAEK